MWNACAGRGPNRKISLVVDFSRIAVIPLILMGWALPSMAARQVTVAELQQLLVAQEAAHKSDAEIAKKLSDLELTEN